MRYIFNSSDIISGKNRFVNEDINVKNIEKIAAEKIALPIDAKLISQEFIVLINPEISGIKSEINIMINGEYEEEAMIKITNEKIESKIG